jgi:opacity protein-like surface antigen
MHQSFLRSFMHRAALVAPICVLGMALTVSSVHAAFAQLAPPPPAQPPAPAQPPSESPDPTDPDDHRPAPPASTKTDEKASQPQKAQQPPQQEQQQRSQRRPVPTPPPRRYARTPERAFRIAGFGEFGNMSFTASQSFNATLNQSSAPFYGGGAQFALRSGIFVQLDITHLSQNGQRVFFNSGQVFKLGIPMTVSMTPIDVAGGYRFRFGRRRGPTLPDRPTAAERFVPYVGGGVGTVRYQETSKFAQPSDNVDSSFTSYNFLAGLELGIWRWIGAGVEFHQRWVPDGLGTGGVSKAFNETDLGGSSLRLKIIVGF